MNSTGTLVFLWTPWSVLLSVLAVLGMAGLCLTAWRRSGYQPAVALLEGLRLTIVVLAALMFNQPEWIETFEPKEKPTILVCWDDSPSMETRDVITTEFGVERSVADGHAAGAEQVAEAEWAAGLKQGPGQSLRSRREAIEPLLMDASWNRLRNRNRVVIEPLATSRPQADSGPRRSDLYQPLVRAIEKYPHLQGIVLVSDGDWNEGRPPVQAAVRLRAVGVPVFAVPVGSPTRLPDVELLSLEVPTFAVVGKGVRVGWTLESSLPREIRTKVVLSSSTGAEVSKEIRIAPMGRSSDWLHWKPQETRRSDTHSHRASARG